MGIALSLFLYKRGEVILFRLKTYKIGRVLFSFFSKKWYFDLVYNRYLVDFFFKVAYRGTFKAIDKGLLEHFGPSGIQKLFYKLSYYFHVFQTGYVYSYVFLMITGVLSLLALSMYWVDSLFVQGVGVCIVLTLLLINKKL